MLFVLQVDVSLATAAQTVPLDADVAVAMAQRLLLKRARAADKSDVRSVLNSFVLSVFHGRLSASLLCFFPFDVYRLSHSCSHSLLLALSRPRRRSACRLCCGADRPAPV